MLSKQAKYGVASICMANLMLAAAYGVDVAYQDGFWALGFALFAIACASGFTMAAALMYAFIGD